LPFTWQAGVTKIATSDSALFAVPAGHYLPKVDGKYTNAICKRDYEGPTLRNPCKEAWR